MTPGPAGAKLSVVDPRIARRQRRRFRDLLSAREALDAAVDERADPWRLTELRLQVERMTDRAAEADELDATLPAMRVWGQE